MNNLSIEQNQILSILSSALFSNEINIVEADYDLLLNIANIQSVFMHVFPVIKDKLDNKRRNKYSRIFFEYVVNNSRVEENHAWISNQLKTNNIDGVVFKGCVSAKYYPNPNMRVLGDVDFWIKDRDINKVKTLFDSTFKLKNEHGNNHIAFVKETQANKEVYELHTIIKGIPNNNIGDLIASYFDDILDRRMQLAINNDIVYVPSDFHHGLILLIHMVQHMTYEGIGLRHLCDWAVFVNSFSNDGFVELFKDKLVEVGLWKYAQIITLVCINYLGMPMKEWAVLSEDNIDDILSEVIYDIFESGNFAQNDLDRYRQIKYMINNYTGRNSVASMFKAIDEKTQRSELVLKNSIFYPFVFVGTICEFGIRLIKRERTLKHENDIIEKANDRKKIYQEFELFQN